MPITSILYLSSQFPPLICGLIFFFLLLSNKIIAYTYSHRKLKFEVSYGRISYPVATIIFSIILIISTIQALLFPYSLNIVSILQIIFYLIVLDAARKESLNYVPVKLISLITWLNFIVLILSIHPLIRDYTFFEMPGGLRFQSIYVEPSYAAFIYILNFIELNKQRKFEKVNSLMLINALLALITFSGSGIALLLIFLITHMVSKINFKTKIKILFMLIILFTIFYFSARTSFDEMILSRWEGIISGEVDNSVFLRFIAPWMFVEQMSERFMHLLLGVGVGGLNGYINYYRNELPFLVFYEGSEATGLNNGYVIILVTLGVPFGFCFLLWIFWLVWRSKSSIISKALLLAYPFFSGWIIHPLYILMLTLVIKKYSSLIVDMYDRKKLNNDK